MRNAWKFLAFILLIRVGTSVHVNPEMICATEKKGGKTLIHMATPAMGAFVLESDWKYETVIEALSAYAQMANQPAPTPAPAKKTKETKDVGKK